MMKGCDIFAPPVEVPITAKLPLFTPFEESYRKKKKLQHTQWKMRSVVLLICAQIVLCITNTTDGNSGSGIQPLSDGGASGSGAMLMPARPVFIGCNATEVTVVSYGRNLTINVSAPDATDSNGNLILLTVDEVVSTIDGLTAQIENTSIQIAVPQESLASPLDEIRATVVLNATDNFGASNICLLSVNISVLSCPDNIVRNFSQDLRGSHVVVQQLDIPIGEFNDTVGLALRTAVAREATQTCRSGCSGCSLSPTCSTFLDVCREITNLDVFILQVRAVEVTRVRRSLVRRAEAVEVEIYIQLPLGAPLLGGNTAPFVPAPTLQQVVIQARSEFQNSTGVIFIGLPALVVVTAPPTQATPSTTFTAIIVGSVLGAFLVVVLVVGIFIVVLVAYIKRAQEKGKVQPIHSKRVDVAAAKDNPPAYVEQNMHVEEI